ncbi:MAG: RecX family transcriptional regulator [Bacilli bacterium]|nr:RecX family transcriptional regulator [Bacilli bacterium]
MAYDTRTITKIKFNKNGTIQIEAGTETLTMSKSTFTNFYLYEGKEIPRAELLKIKSEIKVDSLYKYGLRLAMKLSYSTKEVRDKLKEKEDGEECYKAVIGRLKKEGFLNDEEYAHQYKEEKEGCCYGKNRILDTLRYEKGISDDILSTLRFTNEEEHARAFVCAYQKKYDKYSYSEKRRKMSGALRRRGFDEWVINEALGELTRNKDKEEDYLSKTAASTLKRYKTKYNDKEAKRKTIECLLRKGYSMKDIYRALEEQ